MESQYSVVVKSIGLVSGSSLGPVTLTQSNLPHISGIVWALSAWGMGAQHPPCLSSKLGGSRTSANARSHQLAQAGGGQWSATMALGSLQAR